MVPLFRFSMCNEAFEGRSFAETCRSIRAAGYDGIEIAPFTLAEDPAQIAASQRREYRDIMTSEGLEFAGLHWLMVAPKGLHVTGPDAALREKSWLHIRNLIDLCADLGPNGVMTFGSPKQRCATGGLTPAEAARHMTEGLASVSQHAEERGACVLLEALPADQCDVIQTLAEAVAIVRKIGSPGIQTLFDVHNAIDEAESHPALIERYFEHIRHVHVNELDGKYPGAGSYDFKPVLSALKRLDYRRWVSVEAFDFSPGAEKIAVESLRLLKAQSEG
jgi:D-psicose/D-tagatose/L-ribulose 3-epimerase